jgi:hypothetical protein
VTNQLKAKAYPCTREIQLLHDFGKNSIVASLCARNLTRLGDQDYGYRPAVDAIIDRLKEALTVKCLPRKLEVAADGSVPCSVIEATTSAVDGACDPANRKTRIEVIEPARQRLAAGWSATAIDGHSRLQRLPLLRTTRRTTPAST